MSQQRIWRWCGKCQGLAYASYPDQGVCPAGGTHNHIVSYDYILTHDEPFSAGQANWRWCRKCQGLAFAGNSREATASGVCPAGGTHDHTASHDYVLAHDQAAGSGQANWRWCGKCQGLAFAGNGGPGPCPAGAQHNHLGSYDYILFPGAVSGFRLEVDENGRPAQTGGNSTVAVTNVSEQAAVVAAGTIAVFVPPEGTMWFEQIDLDRQIGITVWEDHPDGTAVQVGEVLVSYGDALPGGLRYELTADGQVKLRRASR